MTPVSDGGVYGMLLSPGRVVSLQIVTQFLRLEQMRMLENFFFNLDLIISLNIHITLSFDDFDLRFQVLVVLKMKDVWFVFSF